MKITEESMRQQLSSQTPPPEREPEPKRGELEKLKAMCWKDRLWYVWAYYKVHMALVLAGILILHVMATSLYRSTFHTALHCMVINSYSQEEIDFSVLEEDFARYLNLGKKDLVTAETGYITFGDNASEVSYANLAKISALVFSKDLDIIIGDKDTIGHFASLDGFVDLEQQLSSELLPLVKGRLFYAVGEDGIKRAVAVDISNTAFVADSHIGIDPPLLGIIINTEHRDNTDALIRYILAP